MPNGTAAQFLNRYPSHDRLRLVLGIARGLSFLHNNKPVVVHGDLKAANVLIGEDGQPCIADFGVSRLLEDSTLWKTSRVEAEGSTRWMSPELLSGQNPRPTTESDIYAFGMTAFEIITGNIPFAKAYPLIQQVLINVVMHGARPARSDEEKISDALWDLLQICWNTDPMERGTASPIAEKVAAIWAKERPVRILCIDHSFTRMAAALTYLHKLELALDVTGLRLGEQFDLICGSSFGGFIAVLIGIFGLDVHDCSVEYGSLVLAFRNLAKGNNGHRTLLDLNLGSGECKRFAECYIEDMIRRHGLDPNALLTDFRFTRPRVLVLDGRMSWRSHPEGETEMEESPPITISEVLIRSLIDRHDHEVVNPTIIAVDEVQRIFGRRSKIGCLISCGLGSRIHLKQYLGGQVSPDQDFENVLEMLFRGENEAQEEAVKMVHHQPTSRDDTDGVFFRYDVRQLTGTPPAPLVQANTWPKLLNNRDWDVVVVFRLLAKQYMDLPLQKERILRCAELLQGHSFKIPNRFAVESGEHTRGSENQVSSLT